MNNATSSSIVHLIITQFTAAYATTTAFAAAATALTTKNGTTIPIITPTAAFGCIPTAYQFIAIYFATANIATVAADASTIHVRSSIAAAAKATTDCLLIVFPYTTAKAIFTPTAANYTTIGHQYNFINCTADNDTTDLLFNMT